MLGLSYRCCIQTVLLALAIILAESSNDLFEESYPSLSSIFDDLELLQQLNNSFTRIVNGDEAVPGEYPYMVSIIKTGQHICGGTLLSTRQHVLTTAQCIASEGSPSLLLVRIGALSLSNPGPNSVIKDVKQFRYHEDFNPTTLENDIAIILLGSPVDAQFGTVMVDDSSPISQSYVNQEAVVVGWGNTKQVLFPLSSFEPPSNTLKKGSLTIIRNVDCGIRFHSDLAQSVLLYTNPYQFLCASSFANTAPCLGDNGGPLFVNNVQVGVISKGGGCADPRYPTIYTRVGYYFPWITNTMSALPSYAAG